MLHAYFTEEGKNQQLETPLKGESMEIEVEEQEEDTETEKKVKMQRK